MPEPLIIQIKGDNSPWNRSIAGAKQGARSLADEQIRNAKRSADGQFVALGKVQLAGVKLGDQLRAESRKTAEAQIKEAQRTAGEVARQAERSAKDVARFAKAAADASVREQQREAREASRKADEQSRQAERAAKEATRQAKIGADGEALERKRATSEAVKDFDRLARENGKQAAQAARAAKAGADAAERELKRSTAAAEREAQKGAAAQIAAQRKFERENVISLGSLQNAGTKYQDRLRAEAEKSAAAQSRSTKKALTEEEVAFAVRNRVIIKANKARVDSATKAATGEKEAFDMGGLAAGGLATAIGSILSVGGAVTRMWDDMRKATYEAALNIGDVRERMLELAALKGRLGDTTEEIREQAVFRSKTLQTEDQARAFQGQMLNVGQANIGSLISQAEFDKAMVTGGQFQAAEGGDAATHGKLTGIIPALMGKQGITGAEVTSAEMKFFNLMQKGGFDFSSGANQLIDKQGLITSGAFKDPARMVATLSALSVGSSPLEAGTHLEHLVEGTTGAFDRMRTGKMDGETVAQSTYLKSIGAKLGMDPLEMGKLIAQDVNQAKDSGGADFDPINYLQHRGYMNRQARMAVLTLAGQARLGQLGMFEERAASPTGLLPEDMADPNFVPADKQLAMFQNSTTAARRRNDLSKQLANFSAGAGPISYYDQWQEMAFSQLKSQDPGRWYGEAKDWKNDQLYGGKEAIQRGMLDTLTEEAKKRGVNVRGNTYPSGAGMFNYDFGAAGSYSSRDLDLGSEASRSQKFVDIAGKLGINLDKVLMDRLIKLNEEQLEATKRMERLMGARAPAAPIVNARPAPANRRP